MVLQAPQTINSMIEIPKAPAKPKPPASDPREEIVTHLRAMRAFAMSLTRDRARADDVVQDTLLKAWSNIEKFELGPTCAPGFSRSSATPSTRSAARRREVADHDGTMSERKAVRPDHDGRLALADFRRAFEALPDVQREALVLVGAEGFSYEEAAAMCGCAVGTNKSRANRGRRQLAVLLQMEEGDQAAIADHTTMAVIGRNPWGVSSTFPHSPISLRTTTPLPLRANAVFLT